jgi:hypothetical protein
MSSFALDIAKWAEKANGRMDLVVRKISLDIFRRIILRSPVDTGRFRGNWQVAIGKIPEGVVELQLDEKAAKTKEGSKGRAAAIGTATISAAAAETAKVRAGDVIYFVNNLPYGPRLENGWSPQAPAGMVGITVTEYEGVVAQAATEAKTEKP